MRPTTPPRSDPPPRRGVAALLSPPLTYFGGNQVRLLCGGDELFPAMCTAFAAAREEIWLATYIFHDDDAARTVFDALHAAMSRGVRVHIVVDGFGSKAALPQLRKWFDDSACAVMVFRPLERWWAWLQPGQLRRLHHKLCVVDGTLAFVGGVNVIDDRHDLRHGWTDAPRLDFAVQLRGPIVAPIWHTTRALWARAAFGYRWRDEVVALLRSMEPIARMRRLVQRLRVNAASGERLAGDRSPVRAAFVVRDNLRRRRAIERSYVAAIQSAVERVDIACPYFYPGRVFRRTLRQAARRGVAVRLLLQGKIDYRIAGLAARVLYDELLAHGVRIYEYTPAYLHAKVAVVDDDWATVGSSNIDPLSLLLNLEANVVVRDREFAQALAAQLELAMVASQEVRTAEVGQGGWGLLRRGLVAWAANVYLRMAGITGRY